MSIQRRIAALIIVVLGAALVYWLVGDRLTWDSLVSYESGLRRLVDDFPVASFALGFCLYVLVSLVPGTTGKSIIYGWLFGFWAALLLVNLGLTTAAVLAFLAIRHVFQDWVHRKFPFWIQRIDDALDRGGSMCLVTLRLLHAPYSLTNYAAGATAVRIRTFWWTTHLGLLPGNIAFVLAGSRLPSLRQVTEKGVWNLIDLPLLVGLSVAALIPVAARSVVRFWETKGKEGGGPKFSKGENSRRAVSRWVSRISKAQPSPDGPHGPIPLADS